jgi:lysophospholipase L1-like esterase
MTKHYHTLLCLGDSYTIGEGVPLHESFPYQATQLLRDKGFHCNAPEIVAKTGWTTFELAEHLLHMHLNEQYDFVTLLIGVNNQYRGLSIDEFSNDFEFLLKKAIHFTNNNATHIVVLSIPDWGVTPFAANADTTGISEQINQFNKVCHSFAKQYGTHYIDITDSTRDAKNDNELLANDHLHYSVKEHAKWAKKVADLLSNQIK